MEKIYSELQMGDLLLKNRIVLAPLTRARADEERNPNDLMAKYYIQRASAGLIITEATAVSESAVGYLNTPGIWSDKQIAGWSKIANGVHENKGILFMQLWHVGRISHPIFLKGDLPVAPSAIKPKGNVSLIRPPIEFVTPRELTTVEIKNIINDYKQAAINAKKAGMDGIEIHAANGYLIDQFLQDRTNKRTDEFGGTIENRCRFLFLIVDACIEVWGASRVGVHLAPRGDAHDMGDSNRRELFKYVVQELDRRKIAFIFTREYESEDRISLELKKIFNGVFIANEKFSKESAIEAINKNQADAVAFGMKYIANPDLVERFQNNNALNETNMDTIYAKGEEGYTDYPFANK